MLVDRCVPETPETLIGVGGTPVDIHPWCKAYRPEFRS